IDAWGMICPGDPARAADFASRAARVSHDGEAVYGAQVVAALVAQAFIESDMDRLLDTALSVIPADCTVRKLIDDLRTWQRQEPDWRANRERLQAEYGYDKYFGQCHLIPNHGLIILSLLHGEGDFDRSMTIVNTSGWDTDCNSGNVGAILGVRNGLAGLAGKDWRGPVADRLYLPSADGGRAITDAAREAVFVANAGRGIVGELPLALKDGARFHFALSGSVQGWQSLDPERLAISNPNGALVIEPLTSEGGRASTATFIPPEAKDMKTGYVLVANPTLYPGQEIRLVVKANDEPSTGRVFLSKYTSDDESESIQGPSWSMLPHEERELTWVVPENDGYPYHEIGLELERGAVELDRLDWTGIPTASFPVVEGTMWARAWAKSVDRFEYVRDKYEYLTHNEGVGLLTQGSRDWQDYRIEARVTPKMAVSAGLALRVQGLRRYYAVVFAGPGELRIVKALDGRSTLAQTSFPWEPFQDYMVEVEVRGNEIRAWIDGRLKLTAVDLDRPLLEGAFGIVVESGCVGAGTPRISPA
ncbi:MAG: ADP-ribosylglycohydrolase family protein, partial [Chlorobia bacterium]|nr:ADP-ribosylglycohydrolase family protein [Fimbriimonadaceae bacterium]